MEGAKVESVSLYGRLPEIDLNLSNGLHLLSMMTSEGDPDWVLLRRNQENSDSVYVRAGRLCFDAKTELSRD